MKKYRPSNGSEGMNFMRYFCDRCKYNINQDCEILANSICYDINDPEYPKEWIYDENNDSICIKFKVIK